MHKSSNRRKAKAKLELVEQSSNVLECDVEPLKKLELRTVDIQKLLSQDMIAQGGNHVFFIREAALLHDLGHLDTPNPQNMFDDNFKLLNSSPKSFPRPESSVLHPRKFYRINRTIGQDNTIVRFFTGIYTRWLVETHEHQGELISAYWHNITDLMNEVISHFNPTIYPPCSQQLFDQLDVQDNIKQWLNWRVDPKQTRAYKDSSWPTIVLNFGCGQYVGNTYTALRITAQFESQNGKPIFQHLSVDRPT